MQNRMIIVPEPLRCFAMVMGEPVYMVGGAVRNALLGMPYTDLDVCGGIDPSIVEKRCMDAGLPICKINKGLGTIGVKVQGETVEYTAFRTERYAPGGGHIPEVVTIGGTMETDAVRRDFTVNAMYVDCLTGILYDPLFGERDLERRVLRQCSPVTLASDALRILRLVRFAGELGFGPEQETLETARSHAAGLADIAPERRREELCKILLCDEKHPPLTKGTEPVLKALHLLTELNLWPYLFPDMTEGKELTQRADYHCFNVMEHMLRACQEAEPRLVARLAALLHDIGKPAALRQDGNYYRHDRIGAMLAYEHMEALRFSNALRDEVTALVRWHMYDIQGMTKENKLREKFVLWGRELTRELIVLREADMRGSGKEPGYRAERWRKIYAQMLEDGTPWSVKELALSGNDILKICGRPGGPWVGQRQEELLRYCVFHPRDNNREALEKLLLQEKSDAETGLKS